MKLFCDLVKNKRNMALLGSFLVVTTLIFWGIYFSRLADVSGYYSKQTDKKHYSAMVTKQKDGGYKISYSLESKEGLDTFSNTNMEFLVSERISLGKRVEGTSAAKKQKGRAEQSDVEIVFEKNTLTVRGLEKKDIVLDKVNVK